MATIISIIILVSYIYSASILLLYQLINWPVQTHRNIYRPAFSNLKVKESKVTHMTLTRMQMT